MQETTVISLFKEEWNCGRERSNRPYIKPSELILRI